jgi:hypothetical protein
LLWEEAVRTRLCRYDARVQCESPSAQHKSEEMIEVLLPGVISRLGNSLNPKIKKITQGSSIMSSTKRNMRTNQVSIQRFERNETRKINSQSRTQISDITSSSISN